jgi:cell division protein FtsI (penicillin-binding protein 3)
MSSFVRHIHRKVHTLQGERQTALDLARGRSAFILTSFLLLYGIVALRVLELTYIRPYFLKQETPIMASIDEVKPISKETRGKIVDREGNILASNVAVTALYIDPIFIQNKDTAYNDLKKIFPKESAETLKERVFSGKRNILVRADLTPKEQDAILQAGHPGLLFKKEYMRIYPQGEQTAHLVGFVGSDGKGLEGLERIFDKQLNKGEDVTLAVDLRLQYAMHKALALKMKDFQAKAAAGIVMNIKTGEILSSVSLPDYDPNVFANAKPHQRSDATINGVYEMGSTFKIFSTAALFESKDPDMTLSYDATKPLVAGRFKIHDYHAEKRVLTIPEIFMHSSNIGSALIGQDIGTDKLKTVYRDLGLLDRVNVSGMTTAQPLVPNPWRPVSTFTASYGHGIAVTPMNMVQAVGTLANGGVKTTPTFIKAREQKLRQTRILSEKTSKQMLQLMRLVVTNGTGGNAEVAGYHVAGKTGTAEKISASGGYQKDKLLSSFIGVFPAYDPQYVVFVMVDEPKGNKKSYGYATAGWTAAPAVSDVVQSMAAILGLPKNTDLTKDTQMVGRLQEIIDQSETSQQRSAKLASN